MKYFLVLHIFFIQIFLISSSTDYQIIRKDLLTTENEIEGIYELQDSILVFIKGGSIFRVSYITGEVIKEQENKFNKNSFSIQVTPAKDDKIIVAFGHYLLYLLDSGLNIIGTQINFSPYDIEKIYDSTILEVNSQSISCDINQDKVTNYEVLIGFGYYYEESKTYKFILQEYMLNDETDTFTFSDQLILSETYSSLHNNFINCKYIQKGLVIFCAYIDKDDTLNIGFVNREFTKIEIFGVVSIQVAEVKIAKLNENSVSLIYYDKSSSKRVYVKRYKINDKNVIIAGVQMWDQPNIVEEKSIPFTKRTENSVVFIDNKGYYETTFIQYESDKNVIRYINLQESLDNQINVANINGEGLAICGKKGNVVKLIFVPNIPKCEHQTVNLDSYSSFRLRPIDSSDNNLLYLAEIVKEGNDTGTITYTDKEISYSSGKVGVAYITYYVKTKSNNALDSKTCSIYLKVCHKGCSNCKNNQCQGTCEEGFAFTNDYTSCLSVSDGADGYYYSDGVFYKCHDNCLRCYGSGNSENPNCSKCREGMQYNSDKRKCHCDTEIYSWYYGPDGDPICTECGKYCPSSHPHFISKAKQCVETCQGNYPYHIKDSYECLEACPIDSYPYVLADLNQCVKECPKEEYPYHIHNRNECYKSCPYSYPYLIDDLKECVSNCQETQYKYLIPKLNKCVVECPSEKYNLKYEYNCIDECPNGTSQKGQECKENTVSYIIESITSNLLEAYKTLPQAVYHDIKYQIYETSEEGKKIAKQMKNVSFIYTDEIERKIKEVNNIKENENLLIFKLDISRKNQTSNQVEYLFYDKEGNLLDISKLGNEFNITVESPVLPSENETIKLSLAKRIKEWGYDMYNSSDKFYNDVCTPFTTEYNTDIMIDDRKKEIYTNVSFCEKDCEYQGINLIDLRVNCSCKVKTGMQEFRSGFVNNTISLSFSKIILNSNIRIFLCPKKIFNLSLLKKNKGGLVILTIGGIEFLIIVLYSVFRVNPIIKIINEILRQKTVPKISGYINTCSNLNTTKTDTNNDVTKSKTKSNPPQKEKKEKRKKHKKKDVYEVRLKVYDEPEEEENMKRLRKRKRKKMSKNKESGSEENPKPSLKGINSNETLKSSKTNVNDNTLTQTKPLENNFENKRTLQRFTDEEINAMGYDEARIYDRRGFCKYYYSILKYDHLVLFTFFNYTDYNLVCIKIAIFFFNPALHLAVNTLFFSDNSFSHTYHNKGNFDMGFELPKIIYALLASSAITFLFKFVFLSQSQVQDIRLQYDEQKAKEMAENTIRCIKLQNIGFFTLLMTFMFLFWYYVSAFCAVYINTQGKIFRNSTISFILSMVYPFVICFITAVCRIIALCVKFKFLYIISKIFQLF